jgi:ribosomal protein S18 acetylase RimI-like enzyme
MPDEYLDGLSVEQRAELWRQGLSSPPRERHARFVTEQQPGQVAGFLVCGPAEGDQQAAEGEVFALNVHPEVWGRGHGGALLAAGEHALAEAGFETAILWVHPGNRRARQFYESAGWTCDEVEREQEILGVQIPEIRYRKTLTPT